MADFQEFTRRMRLRAARVPENAAKVQRKAALATDQALVLATPVDTGRARSNWRVTLSFPSRDVVDAFAPGKDLGAGERLNAQQAINHARSVLSEHGAGKDIYIANNLPYIVRLNEGHSAQAPAGFVDEAVQTGLSVFRNARLLDED